MSLLLVPATRENLEKSIENSVDVSFAKQYLSTEFVEEILKYSGIEGIRCWALTKNRLNIFNDIKNGDEVLLTEKGTGRFTHYGVIVGKIQNVDFGNALWPIVGDNPWENIYFLANITKINIDKGKLVTDLGYADNFAVPGAIKVEETKYLNLGTISQLFEIPVFQNVAETNEDKDFSGENIQATGTRRVGHSKFSKDVKTNYEYTCAICGITETEFLVAGHISSWAEDAENRLNPQNGICLCSLHDKAFEHGYIGLSDDFKVLINDKVNKNAPLYENLKNYENSTIRLPRIGQPDINFLKKHRQKHNLE